MPKSSFSYGNNVLKNDPNEIGLEPETDESDTEEIMEEIVGDEWVHPFKTIHFKFLNIEIKKEKDPVVEEKQEKGYGNLLGVSKNKKNLKSNRSIKSGMSGKSFRATLKNKNNPFRSLSLGKIKQNYKFQILLGSTIIEIKNFFGCISASLLPYYCLLYTSPSPRD